MDLIVPITVEFVAPDLHLFEFLIGDSDSSRVIVGIQFRVNLKASCGGGAGDQADDRFEASQGLTAPVLADVGEQPMLDLVPLAGTRWKVANENPQAGFVG